MGHVIFEADVVGLDGRVLHPPPADEPHRRVEQALTHKYYKAFLDMTNDFINYYKILNLDMGHSTSLHQL